MPSRFDVTAKGAKIFSPRKSLCTKTLPPGQDMESKASLSDTF